MDTRADPMHNQAWLLYTSNAYTSKVPGGLRRGGTRKIGACMGILF